VIPINYGDVKTIGDSGVKPTLSSRGKVVVDERTNTLIVTDIRSNVEKAKLLVRTLDAQTPQVLIQSQIIEANLDFSRDLGIQWGGAFIETNKGTTGSAKGASGGITTPGTSTGSGDLAVDLPAAVGSGAGGAIQFAIANLANTKYLQVRISALESTGQGRIISSPRLTTLDNTEASIEQGLRIPYQKLTAEGTVSTDFAEANLKLTVTPHVTADGYIRMEIDVKTSEFRLLIKKRLKQRFWSRMARCWCSAVFIPILRPNLFRPSLSFIRSPCWGGCFKRRVKMITRGNSWSL
jgi:type IV pilus assembly protein PilQ